MTSILPPLALVTGGLHRLGAAIAARLAAAGYALALHKHHASDPERDLAAAMAQHGTDWHRFRADLGKMDELASLIPRVVEHFGRAPDLLINNAALFADGGWDEMTATDLARMTAVNYHAPVLLAQAMVAASQPASQPAIVNIVDQRVANPVPDQLAYSLSKGALFHATRTLAVAFGNRARVNAVAPGLTIITDDYAPGQAERIAARMPLGHLPTPADVADAVLFLAQAKATTGQTIFVDGGASVAPLGRDFVYLERGP
jgi:NAD(P)-dependent dehydrogenase (short-subunit alcohol dehydrogenase family)